MTNTDRNIRTLITCFVIALVALVPLRIVEQNNYTSQDTMVLGEETYNDEEVYEEEILDEGDYVVEEEISESEMVLGDQDEYLSEENEVVEEEIIEEEIVLPEAQ